MDFQLRRARSYIQAGAVIAYPTEAVYGLGCDPLNPSAVQRLIQLKQRSAHKGLIILASHPAQLLPYVDWRGEWIQQVLTSWPGPYTWLLPALPNLPYGLQGKHQTIACRVTAHPIAAALCETVGHAVVSTSANQSGKAAARSAFQVQQRCPNIDWILRGSVGGLTHATPIQDACTGIRIR